MGPIISNFCWLIHQETADSENGASLWAPLIHLWARGYFTASSGNVTDEVIAEYIQLQSKQKRDRDDDFTID